MKANPVIKQGTNDLVDGFDDDNCPTDGINRLHLKTKGGSMRVKWDLPGVTLH